MDLAGTVLVMCAIVSYLLALQYGGQTKSWNSSAVIGLFVSFGVISMVFARWEVLQGERAMITPWLMRRRIVWLNCLYEFFWTGSYYVIVYYLPIYFQSVTGASPLDSGIRNFPLTLATSVAMLVTSATISATGVATPIMVLAAAIATLGVGLIYTFDVETVMSKWIGYQVLGGMGYGLGFQIPIIVTQASVKPEDLTAVTAIVLCTANYSLLNF